MITVKEDNNTLVRAALVKNEDNYELELYCYSKGREKKEKEIGSLFQQRFEEELKKAQSALYKRKWYQTLRKSYREDRPLEGKVQTGSPSL